MQHRAHSMRELRRDDTAGENKTQVNEAKRNKTEHNTQKTPDYQNKSGSN